MSNSPEQKGNPEDTNGVKILSSQEQINAALSVLTAQEAKRVAAFKAFNSGEATEHLYVRRTLVDEQAYKPTEQINPVVADLADKIDAIFKNTKGEREMTCMIKSLPSAGHILIAEDGHATYKVELIALFYRISMTLKMPEDEQCAQISDMTVSAETLGGDPRQVANNLTAEQMKILLQNWNVMFELVREDKAVRHTKAEITDELERLGANNGMDYDKKTGGENACATPAFNVAHTELRKTMELLEVAA